MEMYYVHLSHQKGYSEKKEDTGNYNDRFEVREHCNGRIVLCITTKTTKEASYSNAVTFDKWHGFAFYSTKWQATRRGALCELRNDVIVSEFNKQKLWFLAFSWLLVFVSYISYMKITTTAAAVIAHIQSSNNKHSFTVGIWMCVHSVKLLLPKCESKRWWNGFVCWKLNVIRWKVVAEHSMCGFKRVKKMMLPIVALLCKSILNANQRANEYDFHHFAHYSVCQTHSADI